MIFQKLIDTQLGEGAEFFITSTDGTRAQLYPIAEWEAKEAILATLPQSDPAREWFQNMTSYYGAPATIDKQGRLNIPQVLRTKANLQGEVVVLGKAGKLAPGFLEVVNHERFQREMDEAEKKPFDKSALSNIGL